MSKAGKPAPSKTGKQQRQVRVGALLRTTYQVTRERQFKSLTENGFGDLNQALQSVMVYPYPDGVRPGELAERTNMTKQAINYLLGQLEALGYVERRAAKGSTRRLVFLTRRGWQAIDTNLSAMKKLEEEWAELLGQKRFDEFIKTLEQLSPIGDKTHDPAISPRRGQAADAE
jgi:DNA-binding MarR family transcriptional regulator